MTRRMSCSMTVQAVEDREKRVTRRHPDTWTEARPGDRITLIEKGMGLPKGSKQKALVDVELVSVRVEPLGLIYDEMRGTDAEGLPHLTWGEFCRFWADGHGHRKVTAHRDLLALPCRRIEWRYAPVRPEQIGTSGVLTDLLTEALHRLTRYKLRHHGQTPVGGWTVSDRWYRDVVCDRRLSGHDSGISGEPGDLRMFGLPILWTPQSGADDVTLETW